MSLIFNLIIYIFFCPILILFYLEWRISSEYFTFFKIDIRIANQGFKSLPRYCKSKKSCPILWFPLYTKLDKTYGAYSAVGLLSAKYSTIIYPYTRENIILYIYVFSLLYTELTKYLHGGDITIKMACFPQWIDYVC